MPPSTPDTPLTRLTAFCLALPEAVSSGDQHTKFSVRDRTFAYHLVDHHGDGRVALWCKVPGEENRLLAESEPRRFFIPPYLGPKGWVGLDLNASELDWDEIHDLVVESYQLVAPRRLAALLDL